MPEIIKDPVAKVRRPVRAMVGCVAPFLIGGLVLWAQNSKQPPAPDASAQASSQPAPNSLPPIPFHSAATLHHLSQIINWYRHSTTGLSVGQPSDAIYRDNTQSLAAQAVRLAFQSAKAESALIAAQQKAGGAQASSQTTQQQKLAQLQAKTSSLIDQLQAQIENLNSQIAKTSPARREKLISQRDALQGELELQRALLDAVQKMAAFVETNGEATGGLEGGINQLAGQF